MPLRQNELFCTKIEERSDLLQDSAVDHGTILYLAGRFRGHHRFFTGCFLSDMQTEKLSFTKMVDCAVVL